MYSPRANHNVELGNCSSEVGNYVVKNKITISKLMSDPSVKAQVTSRLQDDSSGYPYKVMATAAIFNLAEKLSDDEFAQRLAQLNIHGANVEQFFNS